MGRLRRGRGRYPARDPASPILRVRRDALRRGPDHDFLASGELPPAQSARDGFGYASGALAFDLSLPPGADDDVSVELPLHPGASGTQGRRPLTPRQARSLFARRLAACARQWREKLGRVGLEVPRRRGRVLQTLRSNLAYILVNRDGPAIRPGTRSYARSWIRDGALISAALLRLGHAEAVRAYIEWFAPYQYPDGKVPCCVDRRGADPVPENDSHGELLFLDRRVLALHGRRRTSCAASGRTSSARSPTSTPSGGSGAPRSTGRPRSASSSASFRSRSATRATRRNRCTRTGTTSGRSGASKDAADLAARPRPRGPRARWAAVRDEFARGPPRLDLADDRFARDRLHPGLRRARRLRCHVDDDRARPGGRAERLPRRELARDLREVLARSSGAAAMDSPWDAYTPYEIRTVGAFVRLGWRERAHELLDFFFADRRPAGWNQWAEVVWREPRAPRFIGDMPHAWVGADYIRSVLDLFA